MKEYTINFWMFSGKYDCDIDYQETVEAETLEEAKSIVMERYPRARTLIEY